MMARLRLTPAAAALAADLAEVDARIDRERATAAEHRQAAIDAAAARDGLAARQVAGELTPEQAQRETARLHTEELERSTAAVHSDRVIGLLEAERARKTSREALADARDILETACTVANDASAAFALRPNAGTAGKLVDARTARDEALDRYRALQVEHADTSGLPTVLDEPEWPADHVRVSEILAAGSQRPLAVDAATAASRADARAARDAAAIENAAQRGRFGIITLPERLRAAAEERRRELLDEHETRRAAVVPTDR